MKSFWLFNNKFAFALISLLLFQKAFSQINPDWELDKTDFINYQWANYAHSLVVKAKYTSKGFKSVLYNFIPFYDNKPDIPNNNLFDPLDYSRWYGSNGMKILRDTTESSWGNYTDYHYLHGSTSNFAKDFETDANDNFILIADNRGNGWVPGKPITSNRMDSTQILLCKFKTVGFDPEIHWYKVYGGSSAEYAIAIKKTPDGNFVVLAQTQSNDGDVTDHKGGKDIWILKIRDSDGSIIWKKTIGTVKDEVPTDLEILPDGSIVVSGGAESSSLFPSPYPGLNSFLLKMDESGSFQWIKTFGGAGDDKINAFVPISDGGYISINSSFSAEGDYPINNGGSDVYIVRHNAEGGVHWSKHYGSKDEDIPGDIAFTKCDSMIYASFSKKYPSSYQYPTYSSTIGIRLSLRSDGSQAYFYQETPSYTSPFGLSKYVTPSLVANNKGGILSTNNKHYVWTGSTDRVSRSFDVVEYGVSSRKNNIDTTICKGQQAWGRFFYNDTTFTDTLRNNCQIDTLINKYSVHIINADSSYIKDTTMCYGVNYKGNPVYSSFIEKDTLNIQTTCGPKLVIINTNVKVTLPISSSFSGDSSICPNQKMRLDAFSPASQYLWQDGSSKSSYFVSNSGIYWVEVTDTFGCKSRDSIRVQVEITNPLRKAKIDTAICQGQQAWGLTFYKDSTFSDTLRSSCNIDTLINEYIVRILNVDSVIVKDTSICYGVNYKDKPIYSSFTQIDTVKINTPCGSRLIITNTHVKVTPPIINSFGSDSIMCKNQNIHLNAYSPALNYLWQDGSATPNYIASIPGTYWVEITDTFGCKSKDSITLQLTDLFLSVFADTTISYLATVTITPSTNGTVNWKTDPTLSCTVCPSVKASPLSTTTYSLQAKKDNCVLNEQIKIIVNDHFYMYVPNAFTPNNDNTNDNFRVRTNFIGLFTLDIYNRTGENVFTAKSPSKVWDGTFKGLKQATGNYVYIITYQQGNSPVVIKKGNLLLIR